jgi:hypothetical protein
MVRLGFSRSASQGQGPTSAECRKKSEIDHGWTQMNTDSGGRLNRIEPEAQTELFTEGNEGGAKCGVRSAESDSLAPTDGERTPRNHSRIEPMNEGGTRVHMNFDGNDSQQRRREGRREMKPRNTRNTRNLRFWFPFSRLSRISRLPFPCLPTPPSLALPFLGQRR